MGPEGGLVRQELVQRAIAAVVVHEVGGYPDEILQRGVAIPGLGEVQFTRRLAEAGEDQDRRHGGPGDGLAARGQQPLQQRIELEGPPQQPPEPDVAEGAAPFHAHAVQPDGYRFAKGIGGLEEVGLRPAPGEGRRHRAGAGPSLRIEFAQVRHGLLADRLAHPDRADQAPVRVGFPVLAARAVAQVHAAPGIRPVPGAVNGVGRHYTACWSDRVRRGAQLPTPRAVIFSPQ